MSRLLNIYIATNTNSFTRLTVSVHYLHHRSTWMVTDSVLELIKHRHMSETQPPWCPDPILVLLLVPKDPICTNVNKIKVQGFLMHTSENVMKDW